jgi:hypothetical protein
MYGRDDEDWDQLADAGLVFLIERARLEKLTSYTELKALGASHLDVKARVFGVHAVQVAEVQFRLC